jgi:hypothetical protein
LVASPAKTKLIDDPLSELLLGVVLVLGVVVLLTELEVDIPELGRKSIQGTRTWRPEAVLLLVYCELPLPVVAPLAVLLLPWEVLDPLGVVLPVPEVVELGLRVPEELVLELVAPLLFSEITAKSIRPEVGLINTSRTVPSACPEELVTCAPVSWLARIACCDRPNSLLPWLPSEGDPD